MFDQWINLFVRALMALGIGVFILALLFGGTLLSVNNTNGLYTTWTAFTSGIPQVVQILIVLLVIGAVMILYYLSQGQGFGTGRKGK
jgi:hypothetical protein